MEEGGNTNSTITPLRSLWVIWYAVLTIDYCDYVTTVTKVSSGGMKSFGGDEGWTKT